MVAWLPFDGDWQHSLIIIILTPHIFASCLLCSTSSAWKEMKSDCRYGCHSFNQTPLLMLIAIISFVTRDNANGKRYRRYAQPMNIKMTSIDRICTSLRQLFNTSNAIAVPEPGWPANKFDAFLSSIFHSCAHVLSGLTCTVLAACEWGTIFCHCWQSTESFTPSLDRWTKYFLINENMRQMWGAEWRIFANAHCRWVIISFYSCSPASSFISHFYGRWPCPQSYANHKLIE